MILSQRKVRQTKSTLCVTVCVSGWERRGSNASSWSFYCNQGAVRNNTTWLIYDFETDFTSTLACLSVLSKTWLQLTSSVGLLDASLRRQKTKTLGVDQRCWWGCLDFNLSWLNNRIVHDPCERESKVFHRMTTMNSLWNHDQALSSYQERCGNRLVKC